jgi:hypothetical protein
MTGKLIELLAGPRRFGSRRLVNLRSPICADPNVKSRPSRGSIARSIGRVRLSAGARVRRRESVMQLRALRTLARSGYPAIRDERSQPTLPRRRFFQAGGR